MAKYRRTDATGTLTAAFWRSTTWQHQSCHQHNRLQRLTLRQDATDDGGVRVAQGLQGSDTRLNPITRHAGQQTTGRWGVKDQRVARVVDKPLLVAQRPAQAHVGGLQ
jgi:hypothetical protein